MKIGLIARCEIARGIAIQSKNFYDNMPVDRVLLVRMPRPDCAENPNWYNASHRTDISYDARTHQLDEHTVRDWLDGLDVVFTVETPNDWRMPAWCDQMGVKLIVQGNPEFVRHGLPGFEHLPHPTEWWWPTGWRIDRLPAGRWMPVPMDPPPSTGARRDGPIRFVHVIGKRAWGDRNGSDLLVPALKMTKGPMEVTIHTIDGDAPQFVGRFGRDVRIRLVTQAVEDRWEMYRNQDVLILPRRYGGLCLPAIEAGAAGLLVAMPDVTPNAEMAAWRMPVRPGRPLPMAAGQIDTWDVSPATLADYMTVLAEDFQNGQRALWDAQAALVRTWAEWRPLYLKAMAE